MSVFTSCPSALNVDGYVNEQVSAIAQLAVQVSGTFVTGEIALIIIMFTQGNEYHSGLEEQEIYL